MIEKTNLEVEPVTCDLCGSDISSHKILAKRDKYGFPVKTVICRKCGNIFINPQPTKGWYTWFYNNLYDKIVGRGFEASRENMNAYFMSERMEGERIYKCLKDFLPAKGKMLDVGCSLGGIAKAFQDKWWEVWGIDPMEHHIEFAKTHVNGTFEVATVEDFEPDIQFDLVIIVRTLNHTLSPSRCLRRIKEFLKAEGFLYIMVVDARFQLCKPYLSTQIDHPFLFSEPILCSYLVNEGFSAEMFRSERGYLEVLASPLSQWDGNLRNNYPIIRFVIYKNTLRFIAARLLHKLGLR